jgi:hypothetical protein
MPLQEFLNNFQYDPTLFNPESFKAALLAEHNADIGVWEAKNNDTAARLTAAEADAQAAKLAAWDMMMKSGTPVAPGTASGVQEPPAPVEDPDKPELKGLESFLVPVDKKE